MSALLVVPLKVAVITAHCVWPTVAVVIGKLDEPDTVTSFCVADTVTDAGTVATFVLLLDSRTVCVPAVTPNKPTRPCTVCPPTADGGTVTLTGALLGVGAGNTKIVARFVTPPIVAVISVQPGTLVVVLTVNAPLVWPPGMVIELGTVATLLFRLAS